MTNLQLCRRIGKCLSEKLFQTGIVPFRRPETLRGKRRQFVRRGVQAGVLR